jgi:hypothetical protein
VLAGFLWKKMSMESNAILIIVGLVVVALIALAIGRAARKRKTDAEATPGKAGKKAVPAQFSSRGH